MRRKRFIIGLVGLMLALVLVMMVISRQPSPADECIALGLTYDDFANPERVMISGYDGEAMEPFITRDDAYLFFNNSNNPAVNTNLHYARRIDDTHFEYVGEIGGANTDALDAVATMDSSGNFYFVSTRSYEMTFSTLYHGQFVDGALVDVALVEGVSREEVPIVNFDVEVSADGSTLYFVDGRFGASPVPAAADLVIADATSTDFERVSDSAQLLENVNGAALEYAAAISADELELFFTRYDPQAANSVPTIYRSTRNTVDEPFSCPEQVSAITGFVEAATFSADERSLYYHLREAERFVIYRVTR